MVTDAQYKELQQKIGALENKMAQMSMQISRLMLKNDAAPFIPQQPTAIKKKRDTTKYRFEGKIYCKRRIAYVCVRKFIEDNNIISYDDVVKVFPNNIQGSLGVIKPASVAERYSSAERRFYFSDSDVISLSGEPYVVCAQWHEGNISEILKVAEKLGYNIEIIKSH